MSSADLSAQPEQIGKYRILGTLGQGAMGRVYLGEDPHIGRKVAVKVLSGATGDEARARFLEEARTIGHLSHPEIVTLLEFGFHEEQPFLAMEHLEGESFGRWMARRPPEAAVLGVLVSLCRAIDHAHAQGVLHRDVKPSNLQVIEDGRAKLLDFGIARTGSVALTATGMLMGTPQYLAPEVLNGEGHSTASDVYAVGLVAYEALTGTNPFSADTLEQCLTRVLTATPEPLALLRPDLEPELASAVQVCLARRPAERPATLEPLRRALEARIAAGSDSLAQPTVRLSSDGRTPRSAGTGTGSDRRTTPGRSPRRTRWIAGVAGAVALLTVAGVLTWVLAGPGHGAPNPTTAGPASPEDSSATTAGPTRSSDSRTDLRETEPPPSESADSADSPHSANAAGASRPSMGPDRAELERAAPDTATGETDPATSDRIVRATQQPGEPPGAGDAGREPATASGVTSPAGPAPEARSAGPAEPRESTADEGPTGTETPLWTTPPADARATEQLDPASRERIPDEEPSPRDEPAPTRPEENPLKDEPGGTGATTAGPPPATAAEATAPDTPAPRLDRLTPSVIRRGGVATVAVEGSAFAEGLRVEVRRGGMPVPGIRVRRLAVRSDGSIRLTLFVAPDVPLGLYSVVVVGPDGRTSNPEELEISL